MCVTVPGTCFIYAPNGIGFMISKDMVRSQNIRVASISWCCCVQPSLRKGVGGSSFSIFEPFNYNSVSTQPMYTLASKTLVSGSTWGTQEHLRSSGNADNLQIWINALNAKQRANQRLFRLFTPTCSTTTARGALWPPTLKDHCKKGEGSQMTSLIRHQPQISYPHHLKDPSQRETFGSMMVAWCFRLSRLNSVSTDLCFLHAPLSSKTCSQYLSRNLSPPKVW